MLSRKGSKLPHATWGDQVMLMDSGPEEAMAGPEELALDGAGELDLPTIQSYKSNERLFRQRRSLTMLTFTGVGFLLVSGCIAGSYTWFRRSSQSGLHAGTATQFWGACDYDKYTVCPAPSLLLMPEVHELASKNLLRVGHRILGPQHAPAVKSIVGGVFRNVSYQLEHRAGQVVRELDTVRFTPSQKDAMLNSLRLLGDPRIEGIGLDIAEAISQIVAKPGADGISAREASVALGDLLQRFELGALQEELELARLLWSEGRQWDLTLEPEHLVSMARVSSRWHSVIYEASKNEVEPVWGGKLVPVAEETRLAIVAGALVQARVMLNIMKVRTRTAVPSWVTSLSSYLGIDRQDVVCVLVEGEHISPNRLACPLKFGLQGMDGLRAHYSRQPLIQELTRTTDPPSQQETPMVVVPGI